MKVYLEGNYVSLQTKLVEPQLYVRIMPVLGRKPRNCPCENFIKLQGNILRGPLNKIPISTYDRLSTVTTLEEPQLTYLIITESFKCIWCVIMYKKRESCLLGNTTEEGISFSIHVSFLYLVTPEHAAYPTV